MGVNGYVTGLCERGLKIAKFKATEIIKIEKVLKTNYMRLPKI